MMNVLLAILLQAASDDPPPGTATIDSAVKSISGYNSQTKPIGDEAFLKRLSLDLLGEEPPALDLRTFRDDPDPKKRAKKINQQLEDPRFGPFWADRFATLFFGDLDKVRFAGLGELGPGVEKSILTAFRTWLGNMIRKDKPWTEIVTSILDARGSTEGDPALAYKLSLYREPGMEQAFAESVSRHFLGIRLTCARCHDHPFDKWRMEDYYGLAAFVAGQRAERVNGVPQLRYAEGATIDMAGIKLGNSAAVRSVSGPVSSQFLFGGKTERTDDQMKSLAGFLTGRANTQLPRALVNRVWGWLMGWGIVHPVDDFNLKSRPLSPALLEALNRMLIDHGYSLKALVRAICNSQEYQRPGPEEEPNDAAFRQIASRKFGLGRFEEWTPRPVRMWLSYAVPESWSMVRPRYGGGAARLFYLVPDPKDKSRQAELQVFEGKESHDPNVRQFQKLKSATGTVEGKVKFALSEVSGVTSCRIGSDAPLDFAVLTARGETPSGNVTTFRLEGPADLVASLREEFLALLKGAVPR